MGSSPHHAFLRSKSPVQSEETDYDNLCYLDKHKDVAFGAIRDALSRGATRCPPRAHLARHYPRRYGCARGGEPDLLSVHTPSDRSWRFSRGVSCSQVW